MTEVSPSRPHIIYLEDDPDWIDLIKEALNERFHVIAVTSIPRAKELLEMHDFHLALVDMSLVRRDPDDASGLDLIEFIRSSRSFPDLPVVVFTGYFDRPESPSRIRKAFKEFGVFDFVSKDDIASHQDLELLVESAIVTGAYGRDIGEPARALVVEDIPEWQEQIKQVLEEEGCQVDIASSYEEAMTKLTSRLYHFATVDIRLSDRDETDFRGIELVDILRRLSWSVDVIFISGVVEERALLEKIAFDLNASMFIDKGDFDERLLRRWVRRILHHIIYVTVTIGADTHDGIPTLELEKKYPLSVSVSRRRPREGTSRSLTRPVTSGQFEMEVVVHPFDVAVLPGSTQYLTVKPGDTAEPVAFEISPRVVGTIELVIDLLHKSDMLARMTIAANGVD